MFSVGTTETNEPATPSARSGRCAIENRPARLLAVRGGNIVLSVTFQRAPRQPPCRIVVVDAPIPTVASLSPRCDASRPHSDRRIVAARNQRLVGPSTPAWLSSRCGRPIDDVSFGAGHVPKVDHVPLPPRPRRRGRRSRSTMTSPGRPGRSGNHSAQGGGPDRSHDSLVAASRQKFSIGRSAKAKYRREETSHVGSLLSTGSVPDANDHRRRRPCACRSARRSCGYRRPARAVRDQLSLPASTARRCSAKPPAAIARCRLSAERWITAGDGCGDALRLAVRRDAPKASFAVCPRGGRRKPWAGNQHSHPMRRATPSDERVCRSLDRTPARGDRRRRRPQFSGGVERHARHDGGRPAQLMGAAQLDDFARGELRYAFCPRRRADRHAATISVPTARTIRLISW